MNYVKLSRLPVPDWQTCSYKIKYFYMNIHMQKRKF